MMDSDTGLRPVRVATSGLRVVLPADSGYLDYEMPPDALCQQLAVSMSRRRGVCKDR